MPLPNIHAACTLTIREVLYLLYHPDPDKEQVE